MDKRPDSAAWAARKRKSIDCDFSALRAMAVRMGEGEVGGGGRRFGCELVRDWVCRVWLRRLNAPLIVDSSPRDVWKKSSGSEPAERKRYQSSDHLVFARFSTGELSR